MKVDELVGIYVQLRDRRDQRKRAYEADDEKDKAYQEKIEAKLLTMLDELGTDSFKTANGTAYKQVKMYTSVADWESVLNFVRENNLWHMLTRGVSKKEVEAYIAANDEPPPGLNIRQVAEVNIRRSA